MRLGWTEKKGTREKREREEQGEGKEKEIGSESYDVVMT